MDKIVSMVEQSHRECGPDAIEPTDLLIFARVAELGSFSQAAVRLGLPSAFMTQWVKNHYSERLLLEFRAILPDVASVSIETLAEEPARVLKVEPEVAPVTAPTERPAFDVRFTFERFVVDAANRVAFNAAKALAAPGAPQFSPLYLHSGTGQGKTHLMHAIGQAFLAANPNATAIYVTAERFMFEFVQALRNRDTHAFKTRLRSVDLLMIDDLQFIGGKDATQEEFFHTVNEFMSAGKRLVIAANRLPLDIPVEINAVAVRDLAKRKQGLKMKLPDQKASDGCKKATGGVIMESMPLYITNIWAAIGVTPSLTNAGASKVAVRM